MKYVARSLLFIFLSFTIIFMTVQKKTKIIFFGDSITQMGADPGGYIVRMRDDLKAKGVESQYDLVGAGVGGNKVYDLYLRMDDNVLDKNPDVVVIWVGVNDVWHKTSGTGTDADKFEKFYIAIIKKLMAKNIKVVVVTPAVIGEKTDYTNQQDGDLNLYSNIIRRIAKDYKVGIVDLRKDFREYELKNNPENKELGILTKDRVHLTDDGNKFVAEKMLEVLIAGYK
ncbi:MAG: GDSL-type esterase/lipase family protein [Bacteroidota bacterium]|nr:GDSL-type esterase/lipase family protein [Bacteroidota bacterium]